MKKITSLLIALFFIAGAQAITVAEAIVIGQQLDHNTTTTDSYTIEGYVNAITENSFNTTYHNMTFWIADTRGTKSSTPAGALQCYRARPDRELQQGDKVRVVTKLKRYNSTVETSQANAPVTWLESQPDDITVPTTSPVAVPNVGDARLKVFAQNLRNYYFNFNTDRGNYTQAEFDTKTSQIVDAMRWADADIYAFCELEAQPIILNQLTDSINKRAGENIYAAVADDINEVWSESNKNNIKSGFIYRKDKVKLYGTNHAGSTANYYCNTMRIQVFEELATGARFTLSMNHFKAKDETEDQGNAKREINANQMLTGLNNYAPDPDILAVGDFNCEVGESPITIITNAGYEEQILKYNSTAFSHCYDGRELIDHAFANASMAAQITGAGMYHICTYCSDEAEQNYDHRYSDHDAYVIGLNLDIPSVGGECEDIDVTYLTEGMSPMTSENGIWYWYNNSSYAKASKQGGYTDYMFTPEKNMADMSAVTISFKHAHKFAGTPSNELTLWVTGDYQGDFASSTWQQLTIDPYTNNSSWNWADVTINVPTAYVGAHTVFAFKYMSTATNYATWEIKNLHITAMCTGENAGIERAPSVDSRCRKALENGQLILILPDGSKYNGFGQKIQ